MSGGWNPKLHPRDGENGKFTRNWEARLAEQLAAASKRRQNFKRDNGRPSHGEPYAKRLGFVRVGDHPTRMGAVGGEESYFGTSEHPEAGGVWVDPARPGTQVAPIFRNDFGSAMTQLNRPRSRTEQRKHDVRSRRSDDWSKVPDDRERRRPEDGGKIGRRLEGAPEAAVKELRRAQARARREGSYREPKRRTPRGTQVDSWMDQVNDRIGRGSG